MNIVVVESPAKAKTINKYLGKDYQVLASFGHVRDLPSKDGSVQPESDFAMSWEVDGRGEKRLKEIAAAVRKADKLILATDPDREGEAISWHIMEEMTRRRALGGKAVERVVFNEITKKKVTEAFQHPRRLDDHLIQAYLARRALDYLVGFTLSPLLWRKLPGSRSAGRVQSVALRLICEREAEIDVFRPQEYWSVEADLETAAKESFRARLTHLNGRKLERFDLGNEGSAKAALAVIEDAQAFEITKVEVKQVKRNPAPPFTTSTLQQEASRRLGFAASRTMRIAQKLYEGVDLGSETVGLITYMRTDGVHLAGEAIAAARRAIKSEYGDSYVPASPRQYRSKAKNAQEAHEAIRPTDLGRLPGILDRNQLDRDELAVYRLIWQRTMASQMASAVLDQVSVDIAVDDQAATLHATGWTLRFDGFLRLYRDIEEEDGKGSPDERRLPALCEAQTLTLRNAISEQHFTQPPPRFSEASLIKRLEELGIGRPSTYTSILQVLQDRAYVRLEKRRFFPEDRGRVVTAFLTAFFNRYVEYDFTATMEEQLDDISGGRIDYLKVLRDFWEAFHGAVEDAQGLRISDVIDTLDEALGAHFFPQDGEAPGRDPRLCPTCGSGRLGLRLGKRGCFIGCSNYPDCKYTRPLSLPNGDEADGNANRPRELGVDPESGLQVSLRFGPYGPYVQLGEGENGEKPKRSSLQKGQDPKRLDLQAALGLLALPRDVGTDPETGETIQAAIGRFGPYLKCGNIFANLKGDDEVLTVGLNRAAVLIAEARQKKRDNTRALGAHPKNKEPIEARRNRFGIEVVWGKTKVRLPKGKELDKVTLEQAIEIIDEKARKEKAAKPGKTKSSTTGKATSERSEAKKTASKSSRVKKTTTRKTATKSKVAADKGTS
ncbi:MAG: type I DNA topoisomerase [Rhodospirillales bacterium]|nr:type I DNA topoisomerase [Rhodospirillales bacterium]